MWHSSPSRLYFYHADYTIKNNGEHRYILPLNQEQPTGMHLILYITTTTTTTTTQVICSLGHLYKYTDWITKYTTAFNIFKIKINPSNVRIHIAIATPRAGLLVNEC